MSPFPLPRAVEIDQRLSQKLTLTNKSDKDVCYKIRTTNVKRYLVLPGAGVIAAGDSAEVEVVLLKKDSLPEPGRRVAGLESTWTEDRGPTEDRFLVQAAFQTDPSVKVADFWAEGKGAPRTARLPRAACRLPFAAARMTFCLANVAAVLPATAAALLTSSSNCRVQRRASTSCTKRGSRACSAGAPTGTHRQAGRSRSR